LNLCTALYSGASLAILPFGILLFAMTLPHERRLDWALHHLERFKAERAAWRKESPHRFWTELDADTGKKVIWAQVITPPPASLSLIAGDCIHNLRAALDNLAFELALAYTKGPLPTNIEGRSAFPIFKEKNPSKLDDMLGGVDPLAKAEIEGLQPYKRGDWFYRDPLWQLNQLEVIEKHRLPHTATLNNLSALSFFEPDGIGVDEVKSLFSFFDSSAPIAEYPAFDSTGAEVRVNFTAAFDVCFSKGAPVGLLGESIPRTLESFHRYIVNKVLPPLVDPFLRGH
jgi:hypothetical protein